LLKFPPLKSIQSHFRLAAFAWLAFDLGGLWKRSLNHLGNATFFRLCGTGMPV
jgi:hypothetical protein